MKGIIVNFRRGRHTQRDNQMIITVESINTKEKAEKLEGKEVLYNTGKNIIKGKITKAHGNSGSLRALFEKGMPGQAIGSEVEIKDHI